MWVISQFTFLEKNVYYSEDMKKPEIPRYTTNIGFFLLFWSSNSYDFVGRNLVMPINFTFILSEHILDAFFYHPWILFFMY